MMLLVLRFLVPAICYLIRLFVTILYPLSHLLLWIIGHVRTVLFYRRRSGCKPRHLNTDSAAGLEWGMIKFLMYLVLLIGVAPVLLPRVYGVAALFLRQVDLQRCWRNTKLRTIGFFQRMTAALFLRRVDLRRCWRNTKLRTIGFFQRMTAALFLRRVDLRRCWRNTKLRMIGFFQRMTGQHKWRVEDDRLPENLPRRFSFGELRAATGGFSDENMIGSGHFGYVYKGVLRNGKVIAVKRLSKRSVAGSTQEAQWQFDNEARALQLRHGNIVQLVGYCCEGRQHRLLCYEYIANGSLDKFLFAATLDWAARYKIIKGICRGLRYLHEECKPGKSMLHLDIKPSNILLDDHMNPKISDFGLSRLFDRSGTHTVEAIIAPVGYSAPEYRFSGKVSEKTDIFSFGILLLETATDRDNRLFQRTTEKDEFIIYAKKLASGKVPPPAYVKNEDCLVEFKKCINIGLKCVTHENERPTAGEVMNMIEASNNSRLRFKRKR